MDVYTVNTTIAGPSAGNPEVIYQWAINAGAQRPADVHLYLSEVYRLAAIAGLRAEVVVAQAIHECSDANTGAPFASAWWVNRCNPAGIGITGDPTQDAASKDFGNGTNAARAHVTHLFLYAVGDTLPSGFDPAWDPRWAAAIAAGNVGIAKTIQGLQNTWGIDSNYANALLGRLIALSKVMGTAPATTPPASPPPPAASGGPTMSTTTIPGLPGGPLTTSFPIDTTTYMIPASNTYQRPGIKANTPRRSVQHGTGNPNSLAADDASWVHAGALDANGNSIQESMHFEIDDTQCFQLVPVDEVTWQAADGAGPGNYNGVSSEGSECDAIWSDPTRRAKVIANQAELMGKLAARFSIAKPEQHYDFNAADPNRHDCPNKLRHTVLEDGTLAWDRYVTLWNQAKTAELAAMTGKPVPAPAPTPSYASPAAPEWWGALVKQGYYNDRGTLWYRTNAQYTVTKATPRSRYADPNGTVRVGPDLNTGDVVNAAAIGTSQSGGQWIISTYFTRVNLADLAYVDPAAAA